MWDVRKREESAMLFKILASKGAVIPLTIVRFWRGGAFMCRTFKSFILNFEIFE